MNDIKNCSRKSKTMYVGYRKDHIILISDTARTLEIKKNEIFGTKS